MRKKSNYIIAENFIGKKFLQENVSNTPPRIRSVLVLGTAEVVVFGACTAGDMCSSSQEHNQRQDKILFLDKVYDRVCLQGSNKFASSAL